jgi:hypothetical protein
MFGQAKFPKNDNEFKISRKSLQYFSIHILLKLLREYILPQYDFIASLTAVKMSATIKNNYFLEKVEAPVGVFFLYGLW